MEESSEKCDGYKIWSMKYNVWSAMQLYIVVSFFVAAAIAFHF